MVYESDFYTSRRPYSSRPTVTSYSVTRREVPWHLVPTVPRPSQVPPCYTAFGSRGFPALKDFGYDGYLGYPYPPYRAQPYHRNIPYIGHKRLVIVQPSAHGWRVKQSSLLGEIDRIYHKVRPSLAYQPKEDYLNARAIMSFDDESRQIRAKTAEILKRIHTPVPRAQRPLPLPGEVTDEFLKLKHQLTNVAAKLIFYPTSPERGRHTELPITERIVSDHYIDRLLSSVRPLPPVALTLAQYDEPRAYGRLGKSHLACVTYAGGRPMLRRKNLASVEDYIRDDINVLSHYSRFRQAAEKAPHVPDTEYGSIPHMPPTKSPVTGSWKSNAPRRTQSDKVFMRSAEAGVGDEATQERKKKRREEVEAAAMKEAEDEKRRTQELKRQEELAEQAAAERQQELERKAREEEEERILREEEERQEALRKAQEEEERKAREEEEARIAKEEEERKVKEAEAKKKAKEEAARKAEEERKAREEEEKRIKEEEERREREEEERRIEEEERLAREEEERKAEEERIAREEEERIAREEEEKQKALEEQEGEEEEEKEPEEEPQVEEVNDPEVEESGNEPVVEEPQEDPAKVPAEEEEDEEVEDEEDE